VEIHDSTYSMCRGRRKMIRFINLTGQILIDDPEVNFAWFDTITDEFITFCGCQDWNTWKEFEQDLVLHYSRKVLELDTKDIQKMISRFKRLYPPTVLFMEGYKEPEEPKNHPTTTKVTKTAD